MKQVVVIIAVLGFLIFRPYALHNSTILYSGDDQNYFAHASAIAFGEFPDYQHEHYVWGGKIPLHSIGPGLMAAPFVSLFSFLDRWFGNAIIHFRTEQNIRGSWALFGFIFSSVFYFYGACLLIFYALQRFVSRPAAVAAIFFSVLCQGVPLYAFRRPIYSHIYEFFLQCLMVAQFLIRSSNAELEKGRVIGFIESIGIGIFSGLIFLVRYNNLGFSIIWPLLFLPFYPGKSLISGKWKMLFLAYLSSAILIGLFLLYPWYINYCAGPNPPPILYGGVGDNMMENLIGSWGGIWQKLQSTPKLLLGIDWGLVWTAPFLLIGLYLALFSKYPLKSYLLIAAIPLLINFWVVLSWIPKWQQGNWYGYRFLIFSAIPIVIFPLSIFIDKVIKEKRLLLKVLLGFVSLFPFLSMMLFDGNSNSLTLSENHSVNHLYQLNVWKTALFDFSGLMVALVKGGPLYMAYLVSNLLHFDQKLPQIVLEKYLSADLQLFIRTLLIYFFPIILWMSFSKNQSLRLGSHSPNKNNS